jgi:hypothetical protein
MDDDEVFKYLEALNKRSDYDLFILTKEKLQQLQYIAEVIELRRH